MASVVCNSANGCGDASVHKILMDIQTTTNWVNNFEHNAVLTYLFKKTGIDWLVTGK